MPGSEDLIRIIDSSLEKTQITETIAALQPLKEEIKAFSGISIFTKNTQDAQAFRAQAIQLEETLKRLKTVEQELETIRSKGATANKARTDEQIADSQRQAEQTRNRVRAIRAEEDAYKTLTNQARIAREEFQRLAAQYGVNSKEARAAGIASKELSEHVQKIAKAGGDARTGIGRYTEGIKDFVKEAAGMFGAVVLIQKAFDFVKDSVKDFMAAEAAASRLKNILSNLGRENVLADLNKEAKELSEHLGTVAEKDVTETFQKLITYGKLTKQQILELTPVIADFAAKQRIDMPEATDAITKALEGNARSLKTYGINIKDGKDATERFAIIMDQLQPKVDGAAVAFGETLAGGMKKSEIATEELKVKIGEEFAPAIAKVEAAILEGVKGIPEMVSSFGDAFDNLYDKAKETWYKIKAVFGSGADLANLLADREQAKKSLEENKAYQNAVEYAEGFRKAHKEDKLDELRKELHANQLLAKASRDRYEAAQKLGQLQTENGKRLTDEALKDALVVKQIVKLIDDAKDTRTFGSDPNAQTKPGKAKTKEFMLKQVSESRDVQRDFDDFNAIANRASGLSKGNINPGGPPASQSVELSDKVKKALKDLADGKAELHKLEMQFGNEALHLSESLVKDGYERELNAIQKKIDLNEELHQKETFAIQHSTLSLQEKAAAQILLDAKVAANTEALKRKERDVKVKEAQFDKAAAIVEIAEKTAIAVVHQLGTGDPYTATARGIVVGAIGAAEIAMVAAKPIPTYAKGVDFKPESGPMIVGEKGRELIVNPDGSAMLTPAVPTLMYGQRGAKIHTADEVNQLMLHDIMRIQAREIKKDKTEEYLTALLEASQIQISAMKKKQPIHIHTHVHAGFESHIQNAVRN